MTPRLLVLAGAIAALSSGCTATYAVPAGSVAYYHAPPPVYAERVYGPRIYVAPVVPRVYAGPRWYGRRHWRHW